MTEPERGASSFHGKHDNFPSNRNQERNLFNKTSSNHDRNTLPPPATIDLKSLASENQSIKLIPSVEEIFKTNGYSFDANLDDGTKRWLLDLQQRWGLWKNNSNLGSILHEYFEKSSDPFTCTLVLLINCRFSDCKATSLPYHIVEQLYVWSNKKDGTHKYLTSNLKVAAFNIAKEQKNFSFVKLVVKTYQITEEKENFLPYVKGMLSSGKYKLAFQSIIALNLQSYIEIEDLLVPLVFQDKYNMINEYLSTCPEQAEPLIRYLDSLLDRSDSLKRKINDFLAIRDVPEVNIAKLYQKPLGKLISRLCTTYDVPLTSCQHLSNTRAIGGIRFLIGQKYRENNISDNAWDDLVIDTISNKPDLVQELVNLVDEYDTKEAYKWAKYFKLPEGLYPDNVKYYSPSDDNDTDSLASPPGTSHAIEYYKLSLPSERIIFIDTPEAFMDAVFSDLLGESLVGLDSEWKPSFGTKSTVSLIQIATKSKVFLFDALSLSDVRYSKLWAILAEYIFDNNNVLKLGFGLENDLREIRSSVPGLSCIKVKGQSFLELSSLWKSVLKTGAQMPYKKKSNGEGLNAIVEQCFGVPLRKHEQCSNWENRPLRVSQLEYAALDAFVLIEAYCVLEEICKNASFEDICYKVAAASEQTKIKKPKKHFRFKSKHVNSHRGPNASPVSVENVKFLLENSMLMLTNYLRLCGIDSDMCMENDKWDEYVKTASVEKRYIVIQNSQHKYDIRNIPYNHIYTIQKHNLEAQIKEVLSFFNIQLQPHNLYGRCQNCNSNELVIISQQIMQNMFQIYNKNNVTKPVSSATIYNSSIPQNSSVALNTASTSSALDDDYGNLLESDSEEDYLVPISNNLVLSPEQIFVDDCLTKYGVNIQFKQISENVVNAYDNFYICQVCGKCYWKEGHFPEFFNALIIGQSQTN